MASAVVRPRHLCQLEAPAYTTTPAVVISNDAVRLVSIQYVLFPFGILCFHAGGCDYGVLLCHSVQLAIIPQIGSSLQVVHFSPDAFKLT